MTTSSKNKDLVLESQKIAPVKTELSLDAAQQLLVGQAQVTNAPSNTRTRIAAARPKSLSTTINLQTRTDLLAQVANTAQAVRRVSPLSDRAAYTAVYRFGLGMSLNDMNAVRGKGWQRWLDDQTSLSTATLQNVDFLRGFGSTQKHQYNFHYRDQQWGGLVGCELRLGNAGYYGGVVGQPGNTDETLDQGGATYHGALMRIWQRESALFVRHGATTQYPVLMNWAMFWMNHFAIDFSYNPTIEKAIEKTILQHAYFSDIAKLSLGKFEDMLLMIAKHPAMMMHLNLGISTRQGHNGSQGPNQNYARELLELHTVGVNSGYAGESDIIKVAKLLTGWRTHRVGRLSTGPSDRGEVHPNVGQFYFDAAAHDFSAEELVFADFKFRFGRADGNANIDAAAAAQGLADGENFLRTLARSSYTARRIANKLVAYYFGAAINPANGELVSPSASQRAMQTRLANAYTNSGGDLRVVLKAMTQGSTAVNVERGAINPVRPSEYLIRLLRVSNKMLPVTDQDYQADFETHMRVSSNNYMSYWAIPGYEVNWGRDNRNVKMAHQNAAMLDPEVGLVNNELSRLDEAWGYQRDVRGYIPGAHNIDGLQLVKRLKMIQNVGMRDPFYWNEQPLGIYNQAIGPLATLPGYTSTSAVLSRLNVNNTALSSVQVGNDMALTAILSSMPMINRP